MSATTTQLPSSGEFCKLRYDIAPAKGASANASFCNTIIYSANNTTYIGNP
jgi:hypothetical protein